MQPVDLDRRASKDTNPSNLEPPKEGLALYAPAATQVAVSKSVVITALPYAISRLGTYVLLGNVQIQSAYLNLPAITINAPAKVVLNLNNFALIGYNWSVGLGMLIYSNDVTIEKGTVLNFEDAVDVNPYGAGGVRYQTLPGTMPASGHAKRFVQGPPISPLRTFAQTLHGRRLLSTQSSMMDLFLTVDGQDARYDSVKQFQVARRFRRILL